MSNRPKSAQISRPKARTIHEKHEEEGPSLDGYLKQLNEYKSPIYRYQEDEKFKDPFETLTDEIPNKLIENEKNEVILRV